MKLAPNSSQFELLEKSKPRSLPFTAVGQVSNRSASVKFRILTGWKPVLRSRQRDRNPFPGYHRASTAGMQNQHFPPKRSNPQDTSCRYNATQTGWALHGRTESHECKPFARILRTSRGNGKGKCRRYHPREGNCSTHGGYAAPGRCGPIASDLASRLCRRRNDDLDGPL
jgi:hypothetical protein